MNLRTPDAVETWNYARLLAYQTFRQTLVASQKRQDVSERSFRDEWLGLLRADPRACHGWYVPPPHGMAVLFSTEDAPGRISFSSLRDESSWPSSSRVDWSHGLMYAYASPVDTVEGLPGDFAVTLYFGTDLRLREHFANCHAATREVISRVAPGMEARELFAESERIFAEHGLRNAVVSSTDTVSLDLGHTLPQLRTRHGQAEDWREEIRQGRRFISSAHDWRIESASQITIEPQLLSTADPSLPQVSFHYVVVLDHSLVVLDECDELLRQFRLIP